MGFSHKYEAVGKDGDSDEALLDQSRQITPPAVMTSWWKLLLCNFVAACAGAGVMLFIAKSYLPATQQQQQPQVAITSAAAVSLAPTSTASTSTVTIVPTPSIEYVTEKIEFPTEMSGIILDCGFSPEEAREKGCIYDVMMQDWVPEPCYDQVLTERYLKAGKYIWYADGDGNTTISDEQMAKGEHGRAWMSTAYHKDHCVFSWLKIIRALRMKRGISQELLSYDHVLHCSHGALKQDSEDKGLGVSAPTNYAKCALYDTWKQDFIPDKHDSSSK